MPDRTGGPAEVGTSGQTEGSLVKKQLWHRGNSLCVLKRTRTQSPKMTPGGDSKWYRKGLGEELKHQAPRFERERGKESANMVPTGAVLPVSGLPLILYNKQVLLW